MMVRNLMSTNDSDESTLSALSCLPLKREAGDFFESLVPTYKTARRHIQE
jgi:hypothetical protein